MAYLLRQFQVLFSTLGELRRSPMTSLNTVLVIAIALLLPICLYITVQTTDKWANNWQGRPQLTLFLQDSIEVGETRLIFQEVQLNPAVARAELIAPDQALAEFALLSQTSSSLVDFVNELGFLGENPLPYSIVLMPTLADSNQAAITALKNQLVKIDGVESIRLDLEWVKKFDALSNTVKTIAWIFSGLLAFGLILIISNTIKLLILNRRHEIEVMKLVGATNRFVRRPFLYFGALYGLLGAMCALMLVLAASMALDSGLSDMASAFSSSNIFYRLTLIDCLIVIATGVILGWLSARWSVAQHLWRIRPR